MPITKKGYAGSRRVTNLTPDFKEFATGYRENSNTEEIINSITKGNVKFSGL